MGHGTWMPKTRFEDIMKNNRDSMFVREASVALFSTAGLLGRSVTGMSSNRTKSAPKPALDAVPLLVLTGMVYHEIWNCHITQWSYKLCIMNSRTFKLEVFQGRT